MSMEWNRMDWLMIVVIIVVLDGLQSFCEDAVPIVFGGGPIEEVLVGPT